jgi:hypothetical protein
MTPRSIIRSTAWGKISHRPAQHSERILLLARVGFTD